MAYCVAFTSGFGSVSELADISAQDLAQGRQGICHASRIAGIVGNVLNLALEVDQVFVNSFIHHHAIDL